MAKFPPSPWPQLLGISVAYEAPEDLGVGHCSSGHTFPFPGMRQSEVYRAAWELMKATQNSQDVTGGCFPPTVTTGMMRQPYKMNERLTAGDQRHPLSLGFIFLAHSHCLYQ